MKRAFNDPTMDCCGRDAADCDCPIVADQGRPTGRPDVESELAAFMRDAIPTLAEVMAADEWVTLADGGIVPVRLNRADGWGQDEDRDSAMAQALSGHVKHLDDLGKRWESGALGVYPDQADLVNLIIDLTDTWSAIRKITRSNGGR